MQSDRAGMLLVGTLQGLLLLAAHELLTRHLWPATLPAVVTGWYAAALGVPLATELLWPEGNRPRLLRVAVLLAVVLAALGAYAGYAPGEAQGRASGYVTPAFTLGLGWFIALPFLAIWVGSGRRRFPYEALFAHAWRNTLTLSFAALFTGIFWGLLALWAGLFGVIGIRFFAELFTKPYFIYPATTIAFSLAVHLGHTHASAVTTVRKVTLAVYRGLLPLLSLIALLFLLFLPFTGLQPLWATGHAAALTLTTQLAMVLFINAAYQDGNVEPPFHPWLRRMVELSLALLPVYGVLTLYALGLRVAQYGWTGTRVWAVLLAATAALYALGYAAAVFARRGHWLAPMGPVNVRVALVIIAVTILTNTPLLDPMRIGAASQMARLLEGRVTTAQFDFDYLRFEAGRYGVEALRTLSALEGDEDEPAAIRKAALDSLAKKQRWSTRAFSAEDFLARATLYPRDKQFDPELVRQLFAKPVPWHPCAPEKSQCLMLAIDLDGDGSDEYLQLFSPFEIYSRGAEGWHAVGRLNVAGAWPSDRIRPLLEAGDYGTVAPRWPLLQLGDQRYAISEKETP